jgi:hypothetical protein
MFFKARLLHINEAFLFGFNEEEENEFLKRITNFAKASK